MPVKISDRRILPLKAIRHIRRRLASGQSISRICREMHVSKCTVARIQDGEVLPAERDAARPPAPRSRRDLSAAIEFRKRYGLSGDDGVPITLELGDEERERYEKTRAATLAHHRLTAGPVSEGQKSPAAIWFRGFRFF